MKLVKKMMVAGLTGALMFGNCVTAFASKSSAYLYGQELVGVDNRYSSYFAIVVGDTDGVIDRNELTVDERCYSYRIAGIVFNGVEYKGSGEDYGIEIPELKRKNKNWYKITDYVGDFKSENPLVFLIHNSDSNTNTGLYIVKLPDNASVSELNPDLKKYVIYAKDMSTNPESWRSNANGWWYDNGDGTYPINQWKDIAGKSYYFGSDGYMLHDTKTPDGHTVGSDGALIDQSYILE